MYTQDHKLNTLQDIVNHIYSTLGAEAMIWNNYCAILATRDITNDMDLPRCFNDTRIYANCHKVFVNIISSSMKEGYYDELCWAGLRETVQRVVINGQTYFMMLDKHLLTTDKFIQPEIDLIKCSQAGCNAYDVAQITEIYNTVPVLTSDQVNEVFKLLRLCLEEFAERGILESEARKCEEGMRPTF